MENHTFIGPSFSTNTETSYELVSLQLNNYVEIRLMCSSIAIGPNELMSLSLDAQHKIHGAGSQCSKRDSPYEAVNYKGHPNLDTILNHKDHRWRRQIWDKAFSTKCQLHQIHHLFPVLKCLYINSSRNIRALRSRSSVRMAREIRISSGSVHQYFTIFHFDTI